MRPFARARRWRFAISAAAVACLAAADGFAIEMFTYFGDGSRIGLMGNATGRQNGSHGL